MSRPSVEKNWCDINGNTALEKTSIESAGHETRVYNKRIQFEDEIEMAYLFNNLKAFN